MGDSWEDDDFEVPTFVEPTAAGADQAAPASVIWEEEDAAAAAAAAAATPVPPTQAQLEAAAKRAEAEAIAAANRIKFAAMEGETEEQRKARERACVEDADTALSAELFGGANIGSTSAAPAPARAPASISNAAATLKTNRDHQNYASTVASKFTASNSTPFNIGAFYSKLTTELKGKLPIESLETAITALQNELDNKKAQKGVVNKPKAKSKKEIKIENKKHEEAFGGNFDDDKYASYSNIEDDFM